MEFLLVGWIFMLTLCAVFCAYSILFEWLPRYLKRRKATAADRATEWVNTHPIQPKWRTMK